ncbi:hypothetical protein Q7P37_003582 [Cladosporium fusiforme]
MIMLMLATLQAHDEERAGAGMCSFTRPVAKNARLLEFLANSSPSAHTLSWVQPSYLYNLVYNPSTPQNLIDYSISSPLSSSGSTYPCKGYQNDPDQAPAVTYTAGETYNVTLSGSATHGGGSCQLSLSYDQGETFRVIKSIIGGCPEQPSYNFTVPSYAPDGEALFAWSWQNKIGNREFYMDCSVVQVVSGYPQNHRRQSAFDELPGIWKADLQSINSCATIEGENPVYPNPGPDVEYGDGMDSSNPPTPGDCDALSSSPSYSASSSTDSGKTYSPAPEEPPAPYAAPNPPEGIEQNPNPIYNPTDSTTSPAGMNRHAAPDPTRSTTTVYIDCPETITLTIYPSETPTSSPPPVYTTSAPPSACTGTSASCPCAPGYDCRSIGTCIWACIAQGRTSSSSGFRTRTSTTASPKPTITRTSTSTSVPSPTSQPPNNNNNNRPPYADPSTIQSYLPCVPGSFICTSATQWYTCDTNGAGTDPSRPSSAWVYTTPRLVAAGMECLPFLVPYSGSNAQYAQQNKASQGYYRDDRYVRARPDGDCGKEGEMRCTDGGQGFMVCDQGGWVRMGSVAAGTVCRDGRIERA